MNHTSLSRKAIDRRRGVAATSLVLASALVMVGCSSGESGTEPTAVASGGAGGESVELTMMNHSRGSEAALNALAEQYTAETGITVTVDTPGPADYITKLQSKAQSDDMPDLFTAVGAFDLAPFIKAGYAMDLTAEMDAGWSSSFNESVLHTATFADGNAQGIPAGMYAAYWDMATYSYFVNPASVGIDPLSPPATTSEFIGALNEAGGDNFLVAASLTPPLLETYATNYMTDDEINATLGGEAPWETDAWRKTLQLIVDLRDGGVIANGSIPGGSDDNPTVEQSFFNVQDSAVIFDGSWATSVAATTAPDFTDYGTMAVPAADDGTQDARSILVLGKGALVNPKGAHPEEALDFLKWLTSADQQKQFITLSSSIPTNADLLASGEIEGPAAGLAAGLANLAIIPNQFTTDVQAALVRDIQSLVLGEMTIDEVLADVQAAQDSSS